MKIVHIIAGVAALLTGCGNQDAQNTLDVHNKIVAAEKTYMSAAQLAIGGENFQGLISANKQYLQDVQNIDVSKCPDEYKQAMKGLENALSEVSGYLNGAGNAENIDPIKFQALQDARLNATRNLNTVAETLGVTIIGP